MDVLKSLLDPLLPPNLVLLNTQFDLFNYNWQTIDPNNVYLIYKACRFLYEERDSSNITQAFNSIMQ